MGRWAGDRAFFIAGIVLVSGALLWIGWAYNLPTAQRRDALVLPGFMLTLAGVLIAAIPRLTSLGHRPPARSVATLAALLAEAVEGQWRKEATERRLLTPDPIPMHWSLSDLAVTGSVAIAVGAPESPPAFPPLPQQARITAADLRNGGGRDELHNVYAGLASGRIVVVGAPGAGKSGTAILLLLDALAHRDSLNDAERARVPVPVLLTAHSGDPNTCSVRDWLRDQLTMTCRPLFGHRGGSAEAATLVAARDKVALILDGLDEMDAVLRPAALQALCDAPFRVVVLTRSREITEAASGTWLVGAVAVHLHDVTPPDAVDYLQRARTGPAPEGWADLLTHLGEQPEGVLARGLSTPLTLTLLRDTYQAGDDVSALLDPTHYPTTDAIEQHLIARVLPAAYTPRPGRKPLRYTEQQARQTLSFIARKMGKNRDLAWWHIPRWAPTAPRVLATWLAGGLVFGLAGGFVFGLEGGLAGGFLFGLAGGLVNGLAGGLVNWIGADQEKWSVVPGSRVTISPQALWQVLFFGLMFGFMCWRVGGPVYGIVGGFLLGLASAGTDGDIDALSMGPRQLWRNNRLASLWSGLLSGPVFGFGLALASGPVFGTRFGFAGGLTIGVGLALSEGLIDPATWQTRVAWLQLQHSRHVAAVRFIPFLEDARERDILRTVGVVYQFRHATLQDQLATVAHPPSTCVERPSRPS